MVIKGTLLPEHGRSRELLREFQKSKFHGELVVTIDHEGRITLTVYEIRKKEKLRHPLTFTSRSFRLHICKIAKVDLAFDALREFEKKQVHRQSMLKKKKRAVEEEVGKDKLKKIRDSGSLNWNYGYWCYLRGLEDRGKEFLSEQSLEISL